MKNKELVTFTLLSVTLFVSSLNAQEKYYKVISCDGSNSKAPKEYISTSVDADTNEFLFIKDRGNIQRFPLNELSSKNSLLPNGHQIFETNSSEISPYLIQLSHSHVWNNCLGVPMGHVVNGQDNYSIDLTKKPTISYSWENTVNVDKNVKPYHCDLEEINYDPGVITKYDIEEKNNSYIVLETQISSFKKKTKKSIKAKCEVTSYYLFDKVKCEFENQNSPQEITENFF